jgi:ferredoxin-NADP reductase
VGTRSPVATSKDMKPAQRATVFRTHSGETGQIDEARLRRIATELTNPVYYVAGPPAMVGALRDTLERAGVDADDIRSEDFFGY